MPPKPNYAFQLLPICSVMIFNSYYGSNSSFQHHEVLEKEKFTVAIKQ